MPTPFHNLCETLKSTGAILLENAPLSDWTTFRLGGNCPLFIACATPQQLQAVIRGLAQEKTPFVLIGGGSNLVVSDHGIDRVVIRYVSERPLIEKKGDAVIVSGSTSLDALALYCAQNGLEGLNTMHGIPGTVGGAIVGNAGAFGKQVGDVLKSVLLLSPAGETRQALPVELGFTYRNSKLKETNDIVCSAAFSVKAGDPTALLTEREEILKTRHEKHPDLREYPCAGSFFRNIEPTSKAEKRQAAGWFLEQAGGKNLYSGGAKIFEKHANIIVKGEGCSAVDVYRLSLKMQEIVKNAFKFDLVREVRFVGKFDGVSESQKDLIW